MTKLETLYASIQGLKDLGLPLNEETMKAVDQLEEQLIKEEVLPSLSENIEPLLAKIQRDLILVVEYHPGQPLSVALSRKAKISEILDAKQLTPKVGVPVSSKEKPVAKEKHNPTKQVVNHTKGLRVTFPDGTVIWHRAAIDTFEETLQKIGLESVSSVGIKVSGYNLVSKDKRPVVNGCIWQHQVGDWYVYSNMNNRTKIGLLKKISEYFKLDLKIEMLKPSK